MPRITNNNPNYFSVTWEFTTTCNYACWYCVDSLHDGKYRWPDLKKSQIFFEKLAKQHKFVYVSLSGGEPTLWPELITFIKEKPSNVHIDIVTNGSRSLLWWKKASKYLESACISFHPDTADPDHIIEVIKILGNSPVKFVHVWLIAVQQSIEKCFYLYDKIVELNLPVTAAPKALYNMGMKNPQSVIDDNNKDSRVIEFVKRPRIRQAKFDVGQIKATEAYLDGQPMNIPLTVARGENRYKGWNCVVGLKRLNIFPNGNITKGACRSGGIIGNIYDGSFVMPTEPHICDKYDCNCVEEIRLEKWTD